MNTTAEKKRFDATRQDFCLHRPCECMDNEEERGSMQTPKVINQPPARCYDHTRVVNAAKEAGRFDASTGMMIMGSLRCVVSNTTGGVGRIDATPARVVNTTGSAEKVDATTQHNVTRSLMQQPRTTHWQVFVP